MTHPLEELRRVREDLDALKDQYMLARSALLNQRDVAAVEARKMKIRLSDIMEAAGTANANWIYDAQRTQELLKPRHVGANADSNSSPVPFGKQITDIANLGEAMERTATVTFHDFTGNGDVVAHIERDDGGENLLMRRLNNNGLFAWTGAAPSPSSAVPEMVTFWDEHPNKLLEKSRLQAIVRAMGRGYLPLTADLPERMTIEV